MCASLPVRVNSRTGIHFNDAIASHGQSEKLIVPLSAARPPFSQGLPTNFATDPILSKSDKHGSFVDFKASDHAGTLGLAESAGVESNRFLVHLPSCALIQRQHPLEDGRREGKRGSASATAQKGSLAAHGSPRPTKKCANDTIVERSAPFLTYV